MLHYSHNTHLMFASILQCLNIPYRLKFFKNTLTKEMPKEDLNVIVEYCNIKLETDLKSELEKTV